jgi:hypothetical protein
LRIPSIKELLPAAQMIDLQRLKTTTSMMNMDHFSHLDLLSTSETQQNRNLIPTQQPGVISAIQIPIRISFSACDSPKARG